MTRTTAVACEDVRQPALCPGCAKLLAAFTGREGDKNRYEGKEANIIRMVDCGLCPGTRLSASLGLLKVELKALNRAACSRSGDS